MNNIDFLPQKYRDNDARRRAGLWRLLVALLFGGVIAAASVAQLGYRASVKSQLQQVQPMLAQAQAREAHLVNLRKVLVDENTTANLHATVRAPWPRTQIVAAVVEPLGESIVLESIHVTHRQRADRAAAAGASEFLVPAKEADAESKTAAQQDLETLQAELYRRRTIVSLTGLTPQQSHLHAYLARLQSSPLLVVVELLEVDSVPSGDGPAQLRFTFEAEVRSPLGRGQRAAEQDAKQAYRFDAEVTR